MNKKIFAPLLILIVTFLFLLTASHYLTIASAQTNETPADIIGVKIIPNPNHYSVSRWYESQGFSGSPQALKVDGYEALRDGRTVYVNAANISLSDDRIYTNIYLISYNQDPNVKTIDILGQIISRWKFNDNLSDELATCSVTSSKCLQDSDCANNQSCDILKETCVLKEVKMCSIDEDCPISSFCDSTKAMVIRDINRAGKIEELRSSLAKYHSVNNRYPVLDAGTYLAGYTISTWPSWKEVFLPAISATKDYIDPINRLGACPGHDLLTCWNKDNQFFAGVGGAIGGAIMLPNDSYVFTYTTTPTGSSYELCSTWENYNKYNLYPEVDAGQCAINSIAGSGKAGNNAPVITDLALEGVSGREYNGFIRAIDPDGDGLFWEINTGGAWSGWVGGPELKMTGGINQKKIFATQAGSPGEYSLNIKVSDSRGGSISTSTTVSIIPATSFAETDEYIYRLNPTIPFSYSFYVASENGAPSYNLIPISGTALNLPGIVKTEQSDGINRTRVTYQGIIATSTVFLSDQESTYRVSVTSPNSSTATNDFKIKIKVDWPTLDFSCATQNRVGGDYNCLLGYEEQGVHTVVYDIISPLPPGLELFYNENEKSFYLTGVTTAFKPEGTGIEVTATNEYGTVVKKNFVLKVNNYCGDGVKQSPNTEGKGGMYNNGYEACDGNADVTNDPALSSKSRQYACNTPLGTVTPYPIIGNSYCIFKSPLDGGGYCGDTYCQLAHETLANCQFDCDPSYMGNGNNVIGGSDICTFTYSDWSECVDGIHTRTVTKLPPDCTGGEPEALIEACNDVGGSGCGYKYDPPCPQKLLCTELVTPGLSCTYTLREPFTAWVNGLGDIDSCCVNDTNAGCFDELRPLCKTTGSNLECVMDPTQINYCSKNKTPESCNAKEACRWQ